MVVGGVVGERRTFVRVNSEFPVQLRPMHHDNPIQIHNSMSQDLSEGGMQISSFYFYPVHAKLMLELYLAIDSEPIITVGKVVWVEQVPYQDRYRVGIEFSGIEDENKTSLRHIIDENI